MTDQTQDTEIKVRISSTLKEKAFRLAEKRGIKLSELIRRLLNKEVSKK